MIKEQNYFNMTKYVSNHLKFYLNHATKGKHLKNSGFSQNFLVGLSFFF